MRTRLALVCLIEAGILLALALQVFGGTDAAGAAGGARAETPAQLEDLRVPRRPDAAPPRTTTESPDRAHLAVSQDPADPVGVLLHGALRSEAGAALQAYVSAQMGKERRRGSVAGGRYALVGLRPGTWTIYVNGSGFERVQESVEISAAAVQTRDFELRSTQAIRIRVRDRQGACLQPQLHARGHFRHRWQVLAATQPIPEVFGPGRHAPRFGMGRWTGEMNIKEGWIGTLHVSALPCEVALVSADRVLARRTAVPGLDELEFVVELADVLALQTRLRARIVAATTGAPLPGCAVSLGLGRGARSVADAEGRVELRGLDAGYVCVEARKRDFATYQREILLPAGGEVDLGEIRLEPAQNLRGRVLDAQGQAAGATVRWVNLAWHRVPAPFRDNFHTRPKADGSFVIGRTGAGDHTLIAQGDGDQIACAVFANPPSGAVVLRLGPGGRCEVSRPEAPGRSFVLTVYDPRRRPLGAWLLPPGNRQRSLLMPAGHYPYTVHDQHGSEVQVGEMVFATTPGRLEIR